MDTRTRSTVLVVLGVVLLASTLAVSALVTPDRSVDTGEDETLRTLVGIQGGGPGWHDHGSVALFEGTDLAWESGGTDSYFDVTMLDNGSVTAGFMQAGYDDCGPYDSPCTHTGFRVIDPGSESDPDPEIVSEYSFPVRTPTNSELHDVERLGDGEYLVTDMEHERLAVVEDGEVVWEWRGEEFYDAPDDPTRTDWLHFNDVDVVGDGRYLVSVRNANQILVVERGEGVVEVINEDDGGDDDSCTRNNQLRDTDGDGDVRCGDPEVLDHQHNPQWLGEGAVLVADSDNNRIVELHLNESTDEWEVAWELDTVGGIALDWPRDADRLDNGNTLVTDTLNKRVVEVDRNGTVVWSATTDQIPYEADRLPEGERPTGERYGTVNTADADRIPVLDPAVSLLRGAVPALPYWFTGVQLGLSLVSLGLVGGGGYLRWRA
ncbi:arylsulfotransferase family protein [Halorussus salilacus]|uniref:arylsulfotransferase family protein n=1 Tax=Halorussus salilacus TaxID=2953750 RepID=UPI00209F8B7C|nr:arylsulfotransferase family protein [Halorussus salilacus]USZ67363.1 arylsulfotransferase family protein [Halorussus salilacus]